MLSRSTYSIMVKAGRLGLKKTRHTQDNDFFKIIDSGDKAYWIGFIAADGCVRDCPEKRNYELSIELGVKDYSHLEKFIESINSDQCVKTRTRKPLNYIKLDGTISEPTTECFIRLYSQDLVRSLSQYGIVQNKTYCMDFPENIPDDYLWDYIRGYFDGDGSIHAQYVTLADGSIGRYPRINFTCYKKEFLEGLQSKLFSFGINSSLLPDREKWVLWIRQRDSVAKFCECIYYDDNCIRLDRKYERYMEYFNLKKLPA